MGTNYYRIPTASEVERGFRYIETDSDLPHLDIANPWDEFIEGTSIHLGKRSMGWKFCWNFHKEKYYKDKESLLNFIRSGRVMDEYGEEMNVEEFITMALEWGQPNGLVADKEVDGLRVSSSTEFS
jgi:hypothetical protein